MKKARDENYKYLVIEASFGEYYGFNMKVKNQQAIAMKIMSPNEHDDFMIVGWKASKTLPKWVRNSDSWIDFLNGKKLDENEVFETDGIDECTGIDEKVKEEDQKVEEDGKHNDEKTETKRKNMKNTKKLKEDDKHDDDENADKEEEDEEYEEIEEDQGEVEDNREEDSVDAYGEEEDVCRCL
jgi:hypothetical protein